MHFNLGRSDFKKNLCAVALRKTLLTLMVVFVANSYSQLPEENADSAISDYLIAIDEVEARQGAYSAELSDLFLGLGNSHIS